MNIILFEFHLIFNLVENYNLSDQFRVQLGLLHFNIIIMYIYIGTAVHHDGVKLDGVRKSVVARG